MTRTEKTEIIAIGLSVIMATAMIIAFFIAGNLSVLAEGIDTIFDIVASLAVIAGVRISSRKTRSFPSGLYKVENLMAIFVGILILFGAYELGREAIERLTEKPLPVEKPWLILGIMFFVVTVTALLAWHKGRVGKEENSPSLKADSRQSWTDALASMVIVVGIMLGMAGIKHMDALTAVIVSLFLVWSGFKVVIEGLRVLLDASLEQEILEKVRAIAETDQRIRRVVSVEGRNSGSYRFIMISVVPRRYDLKEDRLLAEDLSRTIRENIEKVDSVTVDLGVEGKSEVLYAIPLIDEKGLIAEGIEDAQYFELLEVKAPGSVIMNRELVENPLEARDDRGMRGAAFLARLGLNILITKDQNIESNPYWILDESGVKVISRPDLNELAELEEAIPEIASGD